VAEGRYRDIADYCLRDVQATCNLNLWKERLAGINESCRRRHSDEKAALSKRFPAATVALVAVIAVGLFAGSTRPRSGQSA